jgi:hypothetical protein
MRIRIKIGTLSMDAELNDTPTAKKIADALPIKADFNTLLKKRFLDLADEYAFLDPFAGEFQYSGGKIRLAGVVSDADLAKGLLAAVAGLVRDQGLKVPFKGRLDGWLQKHRRKFLSLGISVDSLLAVQ